MIGAFVFSVLVILWSSNFCEGGVLGGGLGGYPWNGGYGPGIQGARFGHGSNAYGPAGAGPLCGYEPCSDTFGPFPFKHGRYPTGGAIAGIPPGSAVAPRGFREAKKGPSINVVQNIEEDKVKLAVAMQELNEETVRSLAMISTKLFEMFNGFGQETLELTEQEIIKKTEEGVVNKELEDMNEEDKIVENSAETEHSSQKKENSLSKSKEVNLEQINETQKEILIPSQDLQEKETSN